MLKKMVSARVCLARAQVLRLLGDLDEADNETSMAYEHAYDIGWVAHETNAAAPNMLNYHEILVRGWVDGTQDAERQEDLKAERATRAGSRDEWDALSPGEQEAQWEEFHDLCAKGIADEMYFYRVMMNMHLIDYVGH